jgi:hypothetical protein
MSKLSEKIPSFLWIPIIVGSIALVIGGMLAFFYGIGYIEGFGSIMILVLGWLGFRVGHNSDDLQMGSFGIALGITFFALMGMALDQTGNFIYNQPLEWIFCPADSELTRETIQRGVRGGGVSLNQSFTCLAQNSGEVLRKITGFEHFAFRFVEYVVIGYLLLGLSRLYSWLKGTKNNSV